MEAFDGFHYSFCSNLWARPTLNQELSNIFNELWRLDVNRWSPGIDYTISVQVQNHAFKADCSQQQLSVPTKTLFSGILFFRVELVT